MLGSKIVLLLDCTGWTISLTLLGVAQWKVPQQGMIIELMAE